MFQIFSFLTLGFLFGLKHAFDADHLAAVAALTSNSKSIKNALLRSIYWGIGHTIALAVCGILILGFKIYFSETTVHFFEFFVGVILIILGTKTLFDFLKNERSLHHNFLTHRHFPFGIHHHPYPSLLVGLVHGLAGSAALMVLVLSTIQSVFWGVTYILVFGIGSIAGMSLLGLVFGFSATRFKKYLSVSAGVFSFGLGILMITTNAIFW